ncbi:MAG: hypothetical protein GY811_27870 [Myxococcales bacterium]|nr:hypothetical protein [Myxococcales bacterium]
MKVRVGESVVSKPKRGSTVGFESIYKRAVVRKGGTGEVEALLPHCKARSQLEQLDDDRCLSTMAKNIFRAGFVWKIVDAKWPSFEEAFHNFDVPRVAAMDDAFALCTPKAHSGPLRPHHVANS